MRSSSRSSSGSSADFNLPIAVDRGADRARSRRSGDELAQSSSAARTSGGSRSALYHALVDASRRISPASATRLRDSGRAAAATIPSSDASARLRQTVNAEARIPRDRRSGNHAARRRNQLARSASPARCGSVRRGSSTTCSFRERMPRPATLRGGRRSRQDHQRRVHRRGVLQDRRSHERRRNQRRS